LIDFLRKQHQNINSFGESTEILENEGGLDLALIDIEKIWEELDLQEPKTILLIVINSEEFRKIQE
jgi:hypothetical protein